MPRKRRIAFMLELAWPLNRHQKIFEGTQRYAAERGGWDCVVDEYAAEQLPARRRGRLPFDGVIARAGMKLAERAARLRLPVVNVWVNSPAKELPSVQPDFAAAGAMAAEHLLARGFRRFATFMRRDRAEARAVEAFTNAVREAGFDSQNVASGMLEADTPARWRRMQELIASAMDRWSPPVGVYAGAEGLGRQVAQHCRSRGWRVPIDVAIIAGTNEVVLCEHPAPKLTSIEFGYDRIGYEAARLLDRLIDGDSPPGRPLLVPPVNIVARESTDFFAVDDVLVAAALRFIAERIHMPIDVQQVARAVHASRPTLERRFRTHLGRPVAAEIRRLRIERARRRLADSDHTIANIALDVGFNSAARMNAAFRSELGISPGEYRRQSTLRRGSER